jgi:hypothetical protein
MTLTSPAFERSRRNLQQLRRFSVGEDFFIDDANRAARSTMVLSRVV